MSPADAQEVVMTTIETRRYEMFERVRNFGVTHRDRFPEGSVGGQAFAVVTEALTTLSAHDSTKRAATGAGKAGRLKARAALIAQLEAMAQTAQVIAVKVIDFDDPFRLPRRRQADQTLIDAGQAFVRDAGPHKSQFVAHQMPETFIEELKGLVATLEQAVVTRETREAQLTAARTGMAEAYAAGFEATAALDAMVANEFRADAMTLSVWERVRRIDYPKARKAAVVPTVSPSTSPSAPVSPMAVEPEGKHEEAAATLKVAS